MGHGRRLAMLNCFGEAAYRYMRGASGRAGTGDCKLMPGEAMHRQSYHKSQRGWYLVLSTQQHLWQASYDLGFNVRVCENFLCQWPMAKLDSLFYACIPPLVLTYHEQM